MRDPISRTKLTEEGRLDRKEWRKENVLHEHSSLKMGVDLLEQRCHLG